MRGSYYDVLGVPPDADDAEIRTRYLALMRRHHPDVNRSPMSHDRTLRIGEAFRTLTDPALRVRHDAELAQQRQAAVSMRAITLYRGRKSRRTASNRALHARFGARLVLAALLVVTAAAGWHMERRLGGDESMRDPVPASEDDSASEARQTIAQLNAAEIREAEEMPPVSQAVVAGGIGAFRQIAARGNPAQARAFSEQCHAVAAANGTWDSLDFCVAFDQAAFLADGKKPTAASAGYFVDLHDRAAHLYTPRISSMDAIATRLGQIRAQAAPPRDRRLQAQTVRMLDHIAKRGLNLATSVRQAFGSDSAGQREAPGKPHGF